MLSFTAVIEAAGEDGEPNQMKGFGQLMTESCITASDYNSSSCFLYTWLYFCTVQIKHHFPYVMTHDLSWLFMIMISGNLRGTHEQQRTHHTEVTWVHVRLHESRWDPVRSVGHVWDHVRLFRKALLNTRTQPTVSSAMQRIPIHNSSSTNWRRLSSRSATFLASFDSMPKSPSKPSTTIRGCIRFMFFRIARWTGHFGLQWWWPVRVNIAEQFQRGRRWIT